jgi:hypothetical protein
MPRRHSSGQWDCSLQSDSGSSHDSDSDSEAGRRLPAGLGRGIRRARLQRIVRAPGPAPDPRVICPGCRAVFSSLNILILHRNSSRLANAACRAAASLSANKRQRYAVPRAAGDQRISCSDQIDRMMGHGNQGVALGDAPDPSRYPRHVDAGGVSGLNVCVANGSM